jgi:hypothetical protein
MLIQQSQRPTLPINLKFIKNKDNGIEVTEQDIQKARENDPETLYKIGDAYYKKKKIREGIYLVS